MREETVEEWVEIDDIEDVAEEAAVIEVDEEPVDEDVLDDLAEEAVAEDERPIEVAEEAPVEAEPEPEIDLLTRVATGAGRRESGRSWPARWCCCWRFSSCTRTGTRSRAIRGSGRRSSGIYGALGANLQPDWNLHAYEILQWHLGSDPAIPGTLKVRASLKNVASFAQPYPLLKLVLEDRWGESVREREFEPAEYLDPGTAPDRLLGPAQQATATISIVDPGTGRGRLPLRRVPARPPRRRVRRRRSGAPMIAANAIRIGPYVLPNNLALAPMAGVTDLPFRLLCRRMGAGIAAGEMLTSDVRLWHTRKIAAAHGSHRRGGAARRADRGRRPRR